MCGTNQTNRYIVCCFQRDYCNDLDAYSTTIRATLICTISTITLTTRQPPGNFSILILITIISIIVVILLLIECIIMYLKQKTKE
ncbi:unnamed protein product [Rotaria sp. Silwood1]|nr:unnamed protein product [Rotaria sp. Silwood1]